MTAYVIAAYGVTIVLLGGYALSVALRTRSVESQGGTSDDDGPSV